MIPNAEFGEHENIVRAFLDKNDPLAGRPPIGLHTTAAQARQRAEQRRDFRIYEVRRKIRHALRHSIIATVARAVGTAATVGGLITGVVIPVVVFTSPQFGASPTPTPSARFISQPPPALRFDDPTIDAESAREHLRTLADRARATKPEPGDTTFLHLQLWPSSAKSESKEGVGVFADDYQVWWNDRAAHEVNTPLPPELPQSRAKWLDRPPGHTVATITDYPAGAFPVNVPDPSTQTPILAGQLDFHRPGGRPENALSAFVDLYRSHCPTGPLRAAALEVLTATDGLIYRGTVTDRAGRSGIAVIADSPEGAAVVRRHLLVFHPQTGALLAAEEMLIRTSAEPGAGPAAEVAAYTLFIDCHQTTDQP